MESSRWITTLYIHIYVYIQGDSGGICITLGNDSMSDSKQKRSYEHGSDFERLRSYGHFLIPVHAVVWTALASISPRPARNDNFAQVSCGLRQRDSRVYPHLCVSFVVAFATMYSSSGEEDSLLFLALENEENSRFVFLSDRCR